MHVSFQELNSRWEATLLTFHSEITNNLVSMMLVIRVKIYSPLWFVAISWQLVLPSSV